MAERSKILMPAEHAELFQLSASQMSPVQAGFLSSAEARFSGF